MLVYLTSVIVMDCKLSKGVSIFFIANTIVFLYLFSDFYRKAYKKPKIENNKSKISKSS